MILPENLFHFIVKRTFSFLKSDTIFSIHQSIHLLLLEVLIINQVNNQSNKVFPIHFKGIKFLDLFHE